VKTDPQADLQTSADQAWQMLSGFIQAAQMIPQAQRAADGSLPLTVIGGFLGAGKTTLLNRLLSGDHGLRIAVLVNDFGRINIDAALIRSRTEDTISLANGCACCTIAGDLTKTLIGLAGREDPPEAIVLEASGLADPIGIAQIALANPALRLDGILAVVDAEAALRLAADPACGPTFAAQAAAADLVILNKADLVDADALAKAHALVGELAPGKPVIETSEADVPTDVVLGIRSTRELPARFAVPTGHADAFRSWSASANSLLDGERVREMLSSLPAGTLRAKGILWLSDDQGRRTVFQRVGRRFSYTAGDWNGETPGSSLVVIGTAESIDPAGLSRRFEACRA
jgi:G3E family GTPase